MRCARSSIRSWNAMAKHRDHRDAGQQIDPEHRAPAEARRQQRADERPRQRRGAPDRVEIALNLDALDRRIEVGDDRERDRLEPAAAESLHEAEHHQRDHAPGCAAHQRADQEQAGRCDQQPFSTVEVGESAINRDRDRLRQQIGREHPADEFEAADRGDDRGHRGRDDRGFDRDHEDRDAARAHDPAPAAP